MLTKYTSPRSLTKVPWTEKSIVNSKW